MNLFKRLIRIEEGVKIDAKVHHWSNLSLTKNNFYNLPGYKGSFQLVEEIDEGYSAYNTYVFERKDAPKDCQITKLTNIKEGDIIPPQHTTRILRILEELWSKN